MKDALHKLWQGIKRGILIVSVIVFLLAAGATFVELRPVLGSHTGKTFTWASGQAISPLVNGVPWYLWLIVAGMIIYLWWKHKLVMSLILGVIAGILWGMILC